MKTSVTLFSPQGVDPFSNFTTRSSRTKARDFEQHLKAVIGGGIPGRAGSRPTLVVGLKYATGSVTAAAVQNADTVSLNGQALTATQHNSRGTLTCVSAIATNTVVVNGLSFVGTAGAVVLGAATFSIDSSDTATATSIAAQINAHATLAGVVTATSAAGVVTVRSVVAGAAVGDAITITTTGGTITASAATLSGGATVAAEQFDFGGSNAETATAMAAAVIASAGTLIAGLVRASNLAGTITLASVAAGETVTVGDVKFTAMTATPTGVPNQWSIGGSDTADAAALVVAINAHPALKEKVLATSAVGVVTLRQLPFGPTAGVTLTKVGAGITLSGAALAATAVCMFVAASKGLTGNCYTTASSNGTRLAITGSAARLLGGTESTLSF